MKHRRFEILKGGAAARPFLVLPPYGWLSAVFFGAAVWFGLGVLPADRLGDLNAFDRIAGGLFAGIAWVALLALGSANLLDRESATERLPHRLASMAVLLSWAALLPAASFEWQRLLWRGRFVFLGYLVLVGLLLGGLLLRRELFESLRHARAGGWRGSIVLALLASTVIVLAGESLLDWAMFLELRYVPDHATSGELAGNLVLNVCLVAALLGAVWGFTGRLLLALLSTAMTYGALSVCNAVKLWNLKAPVQLLDSYTLVELRSILSDFLSSAWMIPTGLLGGALLLAILWAVRPFPRQGRSAGILTCGSSLSVLLALIHLASLGPEARSVWLPWQKPRTWDTRQASLAQGFLFHFLTDALAARPRTPDGYTAAEIARIYEASPDRAESTQGTVSTQPDLVLFVVESLMDPVALGTRYSEDPIPFLRALMRDHTSGLAISPSFGGRSANVEFELLTSFSMHFLPEGSIPYTQYLTADLPALPRLLRERGYRTVAVLADPPEYYNRARCYPHLGFEEVVWLHEDPGVERDLANRSPTDAAVVEAVLREMNGDGPTFVFAFTNATHAPYVDGVHPDSLVEVTGLADPILRRELEAYADAVRSADEAIEELIGQLARRARPAVAAILGDHLPPFAGPRGIYEVTSYFDVPPLEAARRKHAVPLVIWASHESGRRDLVLSTNFLAFELLQAVGSPLDPLRRVLRRTYDETAVLGPFLETRGGIRARADRPPKALTRQLNDYRLVQHDALLGNRFGPR